MPTVLRVLIAAGVPIAAGLLSATLLPAQNTAETPTAALIENGQTLFRRDCGFCHGRDAGGGESGPDLTRSKLVTDDKAGSTIAPVIRNGRPDKGMPAFHLSESEITAVVAYIHTQVTKAEAQKGGRRGVDVSDLQTGNAEAGKRYFDGACASCHSPTGDLAGIGTRLKGLRLEQQMLYPRAAKSKVTVTLPDGHTVAGVLAYNDEFTVALRDAAGKYRSWPLDNVTIAISAPAEAHAELLPKYSDDDVHNLMAYLQSLK